ncbi:hypothetical protein EDC04DRAFT_9875 [Pisolithus marmoratus]|nr:hypothetical protein EDC04DRAFT_9875 [Pisolithus marmoratus]
MSRTHESLHATCLGGKSAFAVFVAVLLAFVVETQLAQFLQTTLEYRQSYFIFYIVHSCFSLSLPIHLIYLLSTTQNRATTTTTRTTPGNRVAAVLQDPKDM